MTDPNLNSQEINENIDKLTQLINSSFEKLLPKHFDFKEYNKKLQESLEESIILLSQNDWYINFDMSIAQINRAGKFIENGNINEADIFLMNYFDEEINTIKTFLSRRFPMRKKIIEAAIDAHTNKDYYLSIPVFFAQAEGISQELIKIRFFKTKKGKPETAHFAENYIGTDLMDSLLNPLKIVSSNRKIQDPNNPIGINRHDILHGQSYDYGENPINSYKALSLLNYIASIVFKASIE
ncbi:hypothetical protein [Elizabethkingia miricola]|uniref:hypothetical protein n=1 Tax=Elizabethkingia miricola TaxID=172045 RepID=UPI00099A9923|nr:hypothetical protein [Elizabethkingia miricola]OPC34463.1 hypothetical protein BAX99_06205 [Elizabethkingia miricola]